jgi:hypothetical protein
VVGEDSDDIGAAFDLRVDALEGVGGPDLLPVCGWEVSEYGQVDGCFAEHLLDFAELPAKHGGDPVELLADVFGIGLGEKGPDRRGDHLLRAFGSLGQDVAHEVDPAALPCRSDHHRPDGGLQARMYFGDD